MFNRHTTESVLNAPLPPLSEEQPEDYVLVRDGFEMSFAKYLTFSHEQKMLAIEIVNLLAKVEDTSVAEDIAWSVMTEFKDLKKDCYNLNKLTELQKAAFKAASQSMSFGLGKVFP